jgi:hypothetical protein
VPGVLNLGNGKRRGQLYSPAALPPGRVFLYAPDMRPGGTIAGLDAVARR